MHALFGTKHLIILAICVVTIVLSFIFTRKTSLKQMTTAMLTIGIASEIIKVFYYIIQNEETHGGYLPKTDLPFHLCSIQIIFFAIIYFSKNQKLKRLLLSFMLPSCLIGGFMALLIATDSSRNGMWIITVQYFGYHVALVVFALKLLTTKEIKWQVADIKNCLLLLAFFGFLSIYLNGALNDGSGKINFMYTVAPPEKNLPYLNLNQGWFIYILKYALLAVVAVILVYIKAIIDYFRNDVKKNKKLRKNKK